MRIDSLLRRLPNSNLLNEIERAAKTPRVGRRALDKSSFRKGDRLSGTDEQVVNNPYVNEIKGRFQPLSD